MRSIQRQLTVKVVAASIALSLAAGIALFLAVRWALIAHEDHALLNEAQAITGMVHRIPNGKLEFEFTPANLPDFQSARSAGFLQIRQTDGTVLARSPSLRDPVNFTPPPSTSHVHWNVTLGPNRPGRAVQFEFIPEYDDDGLPIDNVRPSSWPPEKPLIMWLARDRAPLHETLNIVATWLIATTTAFALLTTLAVALTVRRGLHPLRQFSVNLSEIDVNSLDESLPLEGLPEELEPIARRTNELLARLNAAFRRERRFTADVAHELRTPVAELRSLAEVALKWPDGPQTGGDYRDVLAIARQMERLIVTLLGLARAQADRITPAREAIELCATLRSTFEPLKAVAQQRQLTLRWELPEHAVITSDTAIVQSIARNLVENAVEYTTPGGRVQIIVEKGAGRITLIITNETSSLTSADVTHLFEPFWRKDAARVASNHTGVGLALVAAYAKLTNAHIQATQPARDLLRIAVTWLGA